MSQQNQALPPDKQSPPCRLTRTPEGLLFTGDNLSYRITGLTQHNLDRLRITLKAMPSTPEAGLFHVDTIDLYHSRSRESFVDSCAKHLKSDPAAVAAELCQIIAALEAERIAMREQGTGSATIPEPTDAEKKEALETLKSKDLFKIILADFDALGYIGEKTNKLIGILAVTSRLLPDPLALLFLSRPGAGKTGLQSSICKFVPTESLISYTRLTGQSLFYCDENALKNKVLAIEEEEGMREAMYSIKTLISAQKLSVASTRTDSKTGKFAVDAYTVTGPVVVFISTTNPDALDDETRQRFMILTIDETNEQTEKILQAQRTRNTESWYKLTSDEVAVTRMHHTMQRMLKPLTVMFPDDLKVIWPYGRLQMRREQNKFISLIKAITLLYQFQRKTGTLTRADGSKMPYVQVIQQDVDRALDLGRDVFLRNVDDVSPTGRTLLKSIVELANHLLAAARACDPKTDLHLFQLPFTRKELRERVSWSDTQVRRTCEHLAELGYLGRVAGRQGATCRYVLLDTGEDDPLIEFRMSNIIDLEGKFTTCIDTPKSRLKPDDKSRT